MKQNEPIESLKLSPMIERRFKTLGFTHIYHFLGISEKQLRATQSVGKKMVSEVLDSLEQFGFSLSSYSAERVKYAAEQWNKQVIENKKQIKEYARLLVSYKSLQDEYINLKKEVEMIEPKSNTIEKKKNKTILLVRTEPHRQEALKKLYSMLCDLDQGEEPDQRVTDKILSLEENHGELIVLWEKEEHANTCWGRSIKPLWVDVLQQDFVTETSYYPKEA
jgi:hypothetical protein